MQNIFFIEKIKKYQKCQALLFGADLQNTIFGKKYPILQNAYV